MKKHSNRFSLWTVAILLLNGPAWGSSGAPTSGGDPENLTPPVVPTEPTPPPSEDPPSDEVSPLPELTPLPTTPPSPTATAPAEEPIPEAPMEEPMPPEPSPGPTAISGDPCKDVEATEEKKEKPPSGNDPLGQIRFYCAASKAAEKAAKAQKTSSMVHAGVAAVCAANCATEWMPGSGMVCAGAAVAGGVADYALTREFQGALISVAGAAAVPIGNHIANANAKTKTVGKGKSKAACATAAIEAANAFMSSKGSKDSKKTAEENRKKAEELNDELAEAVTERGSEHSAEHPPHPPIVQTRRLPPPPVNLDPTPSPEFSTAPEPDVVTGGPSLDDVPSDPLAPPTSDLSLKGSVTLGRLPSSCSKSGYDAQISCAIAVSGGGLGREVESPSFRKALEKLTGKRADAVLQMESPSELIRLAFRQDGLSPRDRRKLDDALAALENGLSRRQKEHPRTPEAPVLANDQRRPTFLPESRGSLSPVLVPAEHSDRSVAFSNEETTGLEEDREFSLFQRISLRYRQSFQDLSQRDYSTEQNRLLSK